MAKYNGGIWNDDLRIPLLISAVAHIIILTLILTLARQSPKRFPVNNPLYVSLQEFKAPKVEPVKAEPPKPEPKIEPPQKPEPEPERIDQGMQERLLRRIREAQQKLAKADPTPTNRPRPRRTATPSESRENRVQEVPTKVAQTQQETENTEAVQVSDADFRYTHYLTALQIELTNNWEPPPEAESSGGRKVVCRFRINKEGGISDVKVKRTSGRTALDDSAILAIRRTSPFMPLPDDYRKGFIDVTVDFDARQKF